MEKYIEASLLLGSYLDTIGFNNGLYEFNFNQEIKDKNVGMKINYELILDFFFNGGFKNFKIKDKKASDDTILMISTGKVILKKNPSFEDYKLEYIKSLKLLKGKIDRAPGYRTINSIENLKRIKNKEEVFAFQNDGGGNGAAMRSSVIGIKFRNDLNKLIEQSLLSAKMTHTHPYGYLSSIIVAIFTKFAIEKIPPRNWISILLYGEFKNYTDPIYLKITSKLSNEMSKIEKNFVEDFFLTLEKYDNKIVANSNNELYTNDLEVIMNLEPKLNNKKLFFGSSGIGVILFSLYSLINSIKIKENIKKTKINILNIDNYIPNWEMLVIISSLNYGDSDTIGIIAGNWYGALFGYKNVVTDDLKNLEFYDELITLSKDLTKSS